MTEQKTQNDNNKVTAKQKGKSKSPGPRNRNRNRNANRSKSPNPSGGQKGKGPAKSKSPTRRKPKNNNKGKGKPTTTKTEESTPVAVEPVKTPPSPILLVDGLLVAMSNDYLGAHSSASMDVLLHATIGSASEATKASPSNSSVTKSSGLEKHLTPAFYCDPALNCIVAEAKTTEFSPPNRGREAAGKTPPKTTGGKKSNNKARSKSPVPKNGGRAKSPGPNSNKKKNGGRSKSPGPRQQSSNNNKKKKNGGRSKSPVPRQKSKSPARPKKAAPNATAPRAPNGKANAAKTTATKQLPLHVQFDPFMVGMVALTLDAIVSQKTLSTNTEDRVQVLTFPKPDNVHKDKSSVASIHSSMLPQTYLEVEPLISQMVPEEIADAINMELSKRDFQDEDDLEDAEEEEEEVEAPLATPGKPNKRDEEEDFCYQTPPKDFKGRVAFFERLTKQKTVEKPKLDPTKKVKAEVSEKVRSAHDQVRTSLGAAPKKKANKAPAADLPMDMTPLKEKIERVDKFFDKGQGGAAPKPATAKPKQPSSNWAKVETAKPVKFESVVEDEEEEAPPKPTTEEATPKVDQLVTEVEGKASHGTAAAAKNKGRSKSPKRNKGRSKSPKRKPGKSKSPARPKKDAKEETKSEAPVEVKEPDPAPADETTIPTEVTAAPETAKHVPSTTEREEESKPPAKTSEQGRGKSPRRKKGGKSKSPARAKKAESKEAAESTATAPEKELVTTQPAATKEEEAPATEPVPEVEPTLVGEEHPQVEVNGKSKSPAGAKKADSKETAESTAITTEKEPTTTEPAATKEEQSPVTVPVPEEEPALVEEKQPQVEVKDKPAEKKTAETEPPTKMDKAAGEVETRDIAEEPKDVDKTTSTPQVEEFPSLAAGKPKSVWNAESKSYAKILSEGKKLEDAKKDTPGSRFLIPELALAGINVQAIENNLRESANKTENASQPSSKKGDKAERVKMEEMAQRLAKGTPQKELHSRATESGPVEEAKEEVDANPDFKPIKREVKKKKGTAEEEREPIQPLQQFPELIAEGEDAALTGGKAFKKNNFNQFDALSDLGDIPTEIVADEKKEKVRALKTASPTKASKKKKGFRPGASTAKEVKDAKEDKDLSNEIFSELEDSPPVVALPLHWLNSLAHTKPFCYIMDGIFWVLALLLGAPLGAVGILLVTIYKLIMFFPRVLGIGKIKPKSSPNQKLAVVITGCDSGFGKDLALSLLKEGFVVFCGCLRKESMKAFENEELAMPILLDVTKDSDVDQASKEVSKWLSGGEGRYLHALVNNAGIGIAGIVDWTPVGEFQKMIDVNFMGMARCTKKFLPHFKEQATKGIYSSARIVNMVSMAGLVAGGGISVGYEASKHAAEVFTANLRQEMKSFGLKVTVINPSFHKTPLTKDMTADLRRKWKSLSAAKRKECGGEEYFKLTLQGGKVASEVLSWDSRHVIEAMQQSVAAKSPPARILVGGDAKYIFIVFRMLPTWASSRILSIKNMKLSSAVKKSKMD